MKALNISYFIKQLLWLECLLTDRLFIVEVLEESLVLMQKLTFGKKSFSNG